MKTFGFALTNNHEGVTIVANDIHEGIRLAEASGGRVYAGRELTDSEQQTQEARIEGFKLADGPQLNEDVER
jgi:hypothetical protein